jgi:segregation and condensation protein A
MDYLVNLDKFYGPLDLLLYLIEKNEMDLYDIQVSAITGQYLDYIKKLDRIDLENLGSFLIMASYLLNLKSQMLLPRRTQEEMDDQEPPDPRQHLIEKLLEYKKYKQGAQLLSARLEDDVKRVFFRDGAQDIAVPDEIKASPDSLLRAFYSLLQARAENDSLIIPQDDIDVGSKMEEILSRLSSYNAVLALQDFFAGVSSRREMLAFFLALLELIRLQQVEAVQENSFGSIEICLRVAKNNVNAG